VVVEVGEIWGSGGGEVEEEDEIWFGDLWRGGGWDISRGAEGGGLIT
jgi:hypothetical protein